MWVRRAEGAECGRQRSCRDLPKISKYKYNSGNMPRLLDREMVLVKRGFNSLDDIAAKEADFANRIVVLG